MDRAIYIKNRMISYVIRISCQMQMGSIYRY
jgi:hypothetical protein